MFDNEVLRNQQMIEERIEYENDFIYVEGIKKSDELDYYSHYQFNEYYGGSDQFIVEYYEPIEFGEEFGIDDLFNQMREEQLIEMYEAQIKEYCEEIDEISEYDPFQTAIDSFDETLVPEFDYYDSFDGSSVPEFDYDDLFEDCYFEEIPMDAAYCGRELVGYVVKDDSFCDYDYPEGPEENLNGINLFEGYSCPEIEFFEEYSQQLYEEDI